MQRWRERIRTDIIRIKFYREEGEQLENYTKYKLKSSDELASVLDGNDNLFRISTVKVVVFIPPAVEPGEPPISINSIITAFDASLISEMSMVLKPAVLVVTD